MNFLAHALLSNNVEHILLGNLVADIISKKDELFFSSKILHGIDHHRAIDHFTDHHVEVKKCVQLIRPNHGKYAPVVTDLLWDLVLAENWDTYCDVPLRTFTNQVYQSLRNNWVHFPPNVQSKFDYLINQDFLFMYSHLEGMQIILNKIEARTAFKSNFSSALLDYEKHHTSFTKSFLVFFSDLIEYLKTIK